VEMDLLVQVLIHLFSRNRFFVFFLKKKEQKKKILGASQTESVTFGPTPSGTTQVVYKLPLTVKLSSKTAGAKIYYSIQSLNANDTLPPPNWYSPTGDTITLNHNATIKGFFFSFPLNIEINELNK